YQLQRDDDLGTDLHAAVQRFAPSNQLSLGRTIRQTRGLAHQAGHPGSASADDRTSDDARENARRAPGTECDAGVALGNLSETARKVPEEVETGDDRHRA